MYNTPKGTIMQNFLSIPRDEMSTVFKMNPISAHAHRVVKLSDKTEKEAFEEIISKIDLNPPPLKDSYEN